jgi:hypothetical protein
MTEIERLLADLDKLMAERQGWLDEIEQLRALALAYLDEQTDENAERLRAVLAGKEG